MWANCDRCRAIGNVWRLIGQEGTRTRVSPPLCRSCREVTRDRWRTYGMRNIRVAS